MAVQLADNVVWFKEINFAVQYDVEKYRVRFRIYEVEGEYEGKPLYHKARSDSSPDPVESIDEAEVYAHGEVKWDGCSNWNFDEQDRCMLHGCCREDLVNLGLVLAECWSLAATLMDKSICKGEVNVRATFRAE